MLLLAALLTGVVVAARGLGGGGIARTIATKLRETIDQVGSGRR